MPRDEVRANPGGEGGARGRKVLVLSGRDERALAELAAMLRRWEVEPMILGHLPLEAETVIEELEHYREDVAFGVVLATPDDEGHRRGRPDERLPRVGQSVVLERVHSGEYSLGLCADGTGLARTCSLAGDLCVTKVRGKGATPSPRGEGRGEGKSCLNGANNLK